MLIFKEPTFLSSPSVAKDKVVPSVLLHFRSVGEAPALKKNKFKISGDKKVFDVEKFMLKMIGNDKSVADSNTREIIKSSSQIPRSIYLYCGSGFSPTGDQLLQVCLCIFSVIFKSYTKTFKDLFDCFQVGGELTIFYSFMEAWG